MMGRGLIQREVCCISVTTNEPGVGDMAAMAAKIDKARTDLIN
jgi:hypothetical protein